MNKYNENNERHGYWESNHSNGNLWYKGNYIDGEYDGYHKYCYSDETITFIHFFI